MSTLDVALRLKLINGLSKGAREATKDLAGIRTAADRLKGAGQTTTKLGQGFQQAWTGAAKLNGELGRTGAKAGEIKKLSSEVDRLSRSYDRLGRSQQRSSGNRNRQSRDAAEEFYGRLGGNTFVPLHTGKGAAKGAAAAGALLSIGAAFTYAGRAAIAFEKDFAEVKKKTNLPDGAGWAEVERIINENAISFGKSRGEVAKLAAELGAAGIEYEDLAKALKLATKASVGWDMSADEAGQKLAEIKAATQQTLPFIEDLADKINDLGDNSAAKERDILEMFSRSGAPAKTQGVAYDVTLAAVTALRSGGMQPEIASRFFNDFTARLRNPTKQGDDFEDALKKLGMSPKQLEKAFKTDSAKAMIDVLTRLNKHVDKGALAIDLFGKNWQDEATRFADLVPEFEKGLKRLATGQWKGSLEKNLAVALDTTANRLERLSALANKVGDSIGRWALPPINAAIDALLAKVKELEERGAAEDAFKADAESFANGKPLSSEAVDRIIRDPTYLARLKAEAAKPQLGEAAKKADAARERLNAAGSETSGLPFNEAQRIVTQRNRELLDAEIGELVAKLARADPNGDSPAMRSERDRLQRMRERRIALGEAPAQTERSRAALADRLPNPGDVERLVAALKQLDHLTNISEALPGNRADLKLRMDEVISELQSAFRSADLSPAAREVMAKYAQGIGDQTDVVTAEGQKLVEHLRRVLNVTLTPTIEPRLAPGYSIPPMQRGEPTARPPASKKRADAGNIQIGAVHVHGVRD